MDLWQHRDPDEKQEGPPHRCAERSDDPIGLRCCARMSAKSICLVKACAESHRRAEQGIRGDPAGPGFPVKCRAARLRRDARLSGGQSILGVDGHISLSTSSV